MSHLLCMLCGLQRPIKNYDPSEYENELYLITKKSKGYRKGFEDEYQPILGDDLYTPIIKSRILEMVRALKERGIISKEEIENITDEEESDKLLKEITRKMIIDAFTGTSNKVNETPEHKKVDLNEYTKLNLDYSKLDSEHKKLIESYSEDRKEFNKNLSQKDLLCFLLLHFIKYCNAEIITSEWSDFKVMLKSLDKSSILLLNCLFQDLSIEEWENLMLKIQGTPIVQPVLYEYTAQKALEKNKLYNKSNLFLNLFIYRLLHISGSL